MYKKLINPPSTSLNKRTTRHPLLPLCVDLDGTLITTDVTYENIVKFLKIAPWKILFLITWLLKGRAHLKHQLAVATPLRADLFPYHQNFLSYLKNEHRQGRPLYLVTAADEKIAQKVAHHLGFFHGVIASDGLLNQRATQKAQTLVEKFGEQAFIYAGNSKDDLPVWSKAKIAIAVHPPDPVLKKLQAMGKELQVFMQTTPKIRSLLTLFRPHQWAKNTLLFWPFMASHKFSNLDFMINTFLGFISFCCVASSIYIFNDLMDIENDRQHERKRNRPLAAGSVSIPVALSSAFLLSFSGIGISFLMPDFYLVILGGYVTMTLLYSFRLKHYTLIDVFMLSGFYTLRVVAGYEATGLAYSNWLLTFSSALFMSLAFLKRFSELKALDLSRPLTAPKDQNEGLLPLPGRGYLLQDSFQIACFGTTMGYLSVLVFALYLDSQSVKDLYTRPYLLWGICPCMAYFISYLWLTANRGSMTEDPILFATKSKQTYIILCVTLLLWVLAL